MARETLSQYLLNWAQADAGRGAVATVIATIAAVSTELSQRIGQGALAGDLAAVVGANTDGDAQKALDVEADEMFAAALADTPTALYLSEERDGPTVLHAGAPLMVAIDPLDGSSNINTNISVGTIFSVSPAPGPDRPETEIPLGA
ncbi:MAG: fructose-bisphosphatase class I, partial [Caulobacterales bacterium]|nr:fructose-bisphosphatase class I [Caulobacterales bacterium]